VSGSWVLGILILIPKYRLEKNKEWVLFIVRDRLVIALLLLIGSKLVKGKKSFLIKFTIFNYNCNIVKEEKVADLDRNTL
jgi:hypothetical protein